ncbi:peptidase M20 domain-containing protein 2-like [Branchiostoma lanceolatum]|uniref:peptidase M20 domain-containing protein 2-like n=1 Tax=Branchiostoma lanceolatum TaxID=7740 RepID=UPI003452E3B6
MSGDLSSVCSKAIGDAKDDLNHLSSEIWKNPELAFQETHAHNVLTDFLENKGFRVERNFIKKTGFRATYGSGDGDGVHVCVMCEYDALPSLGHAAGRNLSSEASVAAALGIQAAIKQQQKLGKVTVLGTPATEGGGGKLDMINEGCFDGIDFAMLAQPLNENIAAPVTLNILRVRVSYAGKAAHASTQPWEGKNALDAAVACYSNVALMRQQLKPTWKINGIITNGGLKPNIIPEETEMLFYLRAPEQTDLMFLQQRATACFVAAAKATGCEVNFEFLDKPYHNVVHNSVLANLYKKHAEGLGLQFSTDEEVLQCSTGSTDMGNVSHVIPCVYPAFDIKTQAPIHTQAFTEASSAPEAQQPVLQCAQAMAMTALEVMQQSQIMSDIRNEFETIDSVHTPVIAGTNPFP